MFQTTEFQYALRMIVAFIAGGIIGYEREKRNKPAGVRTFALLCLGAAVVTIVEVEVMNIYLANIKAHDFVRFNLMRISAQIVSGIGFLGAGTIIHRKDTISGLTSAASLWAAAMVGIAFGYGLYFIGIMATFLIELTLFLSTLRNYYDNK